MTPQSRVLCHVCPTWPSNQSLDEPVPHVALSTAAAHPPPCPAPLRQGDWPPPWLCSGSPSAPTSSMATPQSRAHVSADLHRDQLVFAQLGRKLSAAHVHSAMPHFATRFSMSTWAAPSCPPAATSDDSPVGKAQEEASVWAADHPVCSVAGSVPSTDSHVLHPWLYVSEKMPWAEDAATASWPCGAPIAIEIDSAVPDATSQH